jgi:ABC-type transport system involved in multi-copper enzyme maturation permease subunit
VTVIPVIARELQARARQASTYWLRVLGAGVLVFVLALALWVTQPRFLSAAPGPWLFWGLNRIFFWAIWLAVPVLTADCISREKREGTLGLLFLTPLTGRDIALAKSAIHALRALTFWAAAVPVLVVPLLMGGITAKDVFFSVLADGRALLLALAAGLLASAWCREWNRALVLAVALSLAFGLWLPGLAARLVRLALASGGIPGWLLPGINEWWLVTVGKLVVGLRALALLWRALAPRTFQALQSAG